MARTSINLHPGLIVIITLSVVVVATNGLVLDYNTLWEQSKNNSSQQPIAQLSKSIPESDLILPVLSGKIESASVYDATKEAVALAWKCPEITHTDDLECGCDIPHTLRCSGNIHGLEILAAGLRNATYPVSLLDCTLNNNVTFLSDAKIFDGISLHGLVISSGEIKRVHRLAFMGMTGGGLEALGLPNNKLSTVPASSVAPLITLDRLDLSNNQIKALTSSDFATLTQLTYLELSDNKITSISPRSFASLRKLQYLKLKGNRLGDFPTSLQSIASCRNLNDLDLRSNSLRGPLTKQLLPKMPLLQTLNLDKNLITSVQNSALEKFTNLKSLSLRQNQIDVLQDHAFAGLSRLQVLDLAHNGIVAISGASLQHLPQLVTLDLTHNFLRALTADMVAPLPSISEIRLDGNDITLIAESAVEMLKPNHSLSLRENPLNCDCTLRPFANWLKNSSIASVGAVCSTPLQLAGAPVTDLSVESLTCDDPSPAQDEDLNPDAVDQIETMSNANNVSDIRDVSDKVTLRKVDLSGDYSLYLNWKIDLDQYYCDALFIYRETKTTEVLIDHVPIQCQDTSSDQENVIVHLADSSSLSLGDSYRFCIVLLLEEIETRNEMVVACSNFTKLHLTTIPTVTMYNVPILSNPLESSSTTSIRAIEHQTADLINKSIGLFAGLIILGVAIAVLLWRIAKIKKYLRNAAPAPLNYICDDSPSIRAKNSECISNNRYYKLQATTSL